MLTKFIDMEKVKIKNYPQFCQYEGKIGEVIRKSDDGRIWTVEMEDGFNLMPFAPGQDISQCELIEEVNNSYEIY